MEFLLLPIIYIWETSKVAVNSLCLVTRERMGEMGLFWKKRKPNIETVFPN